MKLFYSFTILTILYTSNAFAGANPWTQCGIGAMIFNSDGEGSTVGAAISNIIWDLGTTAVSSNGSSQDNCSGINKSAALFIDNTYPQLAQETAQAQGENIVALLDIYQCSPSSHQSIIHSIRNNFSDTVAKSDYQDLGYNEKAYSYYKNVNQVITTEFSSQCNAI